MRALSSLLLRMSSVAAALALVGCGGVGFRVGDDEKKEEPPVVALPEEALKVAPVGETAEVNGVGAKEAHGVIGVFSYRSTSAERVMIQVVNTVVKGCMKNGDVSPKFTWRQLNPVGATVEDTLIDKGEYFTPYPDTAYNLVVDLQTPRGTCSELGVSFKVLRYPQA